MMIVLYCECASYRAEVELGEARVLNLRVGGHPIIARLTTWRKLDGWLEQHDPGCRWMWGDFDPDDLGPAKVSSW